VEIEKAGGHPETRVAPTFSNFCVEYYKAHAEAHLKPRTWSNRKYTLANLDDYFGGYKLTDITTALVVSYQHRRIGEKVQPSTVNDEVKVLRAVMNHAAYIGVPAAGVFVKDLPVRRKSRLRYWNAEQVTALLDSVREHAPDMYWVVLFLLETGCRKGEAIALEFQDVDIKNAVVRIQPNEEWQPKDNEAREIPIDPASPLFIWMKDERTSKRRYVFLSRKQKPYSFWPQRKFDRARTKAGLRGGPHTTRHTFATHFLAVIPDLYLLAKILGHSDISVTKLYAHLLPDHLERARGAVRFKTPAGVAEMKAKGRWI
jgi:integrase/recombinase XerD